MYENATFTMSFVRERLNEKHSKREERARRPQGNNRAPRVSTIHVKDKHLVKQYVWNVEIIFRRLCLLTLSNSALKGG